MERTIPIYNQEKLFKTILNIPENRTCADCHFSNPDWVSTTLGVFICYKCSGLHRSFGAHITHVRSARLDTWSLRLISIMGSLTNKQSNDYWEANLPEGFVKPTFDSAHTDLVNFVRKKYIEKAYVVPGQESPAQEIRNRLDLETVNNANEDKDELFNRKLQELKDTLLSKYKCASPQPNQEQKSGKKGRGHKKPMTLILQHGSGNFFGRRESSPGKDDNHSLVSPQLPTSFSAKKQERHFTVFGKHISSQNSLPPANSPNLPLFRGLKLRTQTIIVDEESECDLDAKPCFARPFFRSNTRETQSLLRLSGGRSICPSSVNSRNNLMGGLASRHQLINYQEEESIFEESRGPTPRGSLEIEMQDMSSLSSSNGDNKDLIAIAQIKKDNIELDLKSCSSLRSSIIRPRTGNTPYPSHIKRPSESFEVPKCLTMQELPSAAKFKWRDSLWKYPILLGCFLLHLVMGYIHSWGAISLYITSFVMNDYKDDRYIDQSSLNMMIFLGMAMGYCLFEKVSNAIGMRTLVFFSFVGLSTAMLICSVTEDVFIYSGFLTIIPGFFIGILYEIPFYCVSQYFLKQQVFLKSIFYIANGLGAFGYIFFSYYYLRNTEHGAELEVAPKNATNFYSYELVSNIPNIMSYMAMVIMGIGVIGSILIHPRATFIIRDWSGAKDREEGLLFRSENASYRNRSRQKANALVQQGLKEALVSPGTQILLGLVLSCSLLSSYLLYSYKYLGLLHNNSDAIMSLAGGIGMLVLYVGKMIGVIVHPQVEFKNIVRKLIMCNIVAGVALFLLGHVSNVAFLGLFFVIMFLEGFMFALIIEETKFVHVENIEDSMVALMILAYAIANFVSFMIMKPMLMLQLESAIILVLIMPLFWAYKASEKYSRATRGNDSELISMLLSV